MKYPENGIFDPSWNTGENWLVFGSNLAGRHGAGAALDAVKFWGAKKGVGIGLHGKSYAIPTKDRKLQSLPLDEIQRHVETFLEMARFNDHWAFQFLVTRIGCGLAGYTDKDIAPMFKDAPGNCLLHPDWVKIIEGVPA